MKKCPYCHAENAEQAEVCKKCFAALPKNLSENTNENGETDRESKEGEPLQIRKKKRSDT